MIRKDFFFLGKNMIRKDVIETIQTGWCNMEYLSQGYVKPKKPSWNELGPQFCGRD